MLRTVFEFTLARLFLIALLLRLSLLCFGLWQDANFPVKYTDLDYAVFTEAAEAVASGGSPYARATYRYPPLFAWLLVPGEYFNCRGIWGKALFCFCDLLVGALQFCILRAQGLDWRACRIAAALFLLSPMAAVTSFKLVLLGDSAVGKSCLVVRFCRGEFYDCACKHLAVAAAHGARCLAPRRPERPFFFFLRHAFTLFTHTLPAPRALCAAQIKNLRLALLSSPKLCS